MRWKLTYASSARSSSTSSSALRSFLTDLAPCDLEPFERSTFLVFLMGSLDGPASDMVTEE